MPSTVSTPPFSPGLLVALTGVPGAGKTRVLAELATRQRARGGRIDGFLAVAGTRRVPDEGASEYNLRMLATNEELTWAIRDETRTPPYRFDDITFFRLQDWANSLSSRTPLIVLDEFAKFEAQGEGLLPLWPAICSQRPRIVVMAVRAGLVEAIEDRIGRKFDVVIDAEGSDALAQLERLCDEFGEWTRIGLFGSTAGSLEMTVGSALHAAKIPLRGLAMSSLQSAMMVFAGTGVSQPGRVVWVPFISGGLKSLSPAGNRVRPMIAIVMQGLLFGGAVQVLGWNFLSLGIAGALVGGWAALQGIALQYLLMGDELIKAYDTVVLWLAEKWQIAAPALPWLVGAWAAWHALVVAAITIAAWRLRRPPPALERLIAKESTRTPPAPDVATSVWGRRLREFGRWQFWLPLLVVAAILLGSGRSWESVAWLSLRFVAVGFVLITLVSLLRPARWAEALRRRGWWGPALALSGALARREEKK